MLAEILTVTRTMLAGLPRSMLAILLFVVGIATAAAPGIAGLNVPFMAVGLIIGVGCGVMAGVLAYTAGEAIPVS